MAPDIPRLSPFATQLALSPEVMGQTVVAKASGFEMASPSLMPKGIEPPVRDLAGQPLLPLLMRLGDFEHVKGRPGQMDDPQAHVDIEHIGGVSLLTPRRPNIPCAIIAPSGNVTVFTGKAMKGMPVVSELRQREGVRITIKRFCDLPEDSLVITPSGMTVFAPSVFSEQNKPLSIRPADLPQLSPRTASIISRSRFGDVVAAYLRGLKRGLDLSAVRVPDLYLDHVNLTHRADEPGHRTDGQTLIASEAEESPFNRWYEAEMVKLCKEGMNLDRKFGWLISWERGKSSVVQNEPHGRIYVSVVPRHAPAICRYLLALRKRRSGATPFEFKLALVKEELERADPMVIYFSHKHQKTLLGYMNSMYDQIQARMQATRCSEEACWLKETNRIPPLTLPLRHSRTGVVMRGLSFGESPINRGQSFGTQRKAAWEQSARWIALISHYADQIGLEIDVENALITLGMHLHNVDPEYPAFNLRERDGRSGTDVFADLLKQCEEPTEFFP
ncbi:MAG: hypothetical protein ACD_62C00083G0018 [uncultured bacterium]|nr:MAG: hypothetical protein ACD_62C00083G0018 [uncultured bacterium]HLD45113.1 T3SS effector HopA1 family protein [bacterium]